MNNLIIIIISLLIFYLLFLFLTNENFDKSSSNIDKSSSNIDSYFTSRYNDQNGVFLIISNTAYGISASTIPNNNNICSNSPSNTFTLSWGSNNNNSDKILFSFNNSTQCTPTPNAKYTFTPTYSGENSKLIKPQNTNYYVTNSSDKYPFSIFYTKYNNTFYILFAININIGVKNTITINTYNSIIVYSIGNNSNFKLVGIDNNIKAQTGTLYIDNIKFNNIKFNKDDKDLKLALSEKFIYLNISE
jgi:hypothetical protein